MHKHLILPLLLVLSFTGIEVVHAQPNFFEQYNNRLTGFLHEKVYLHTDRNIYSANEDLWFKIYLVDARTHIPLPGINNAYVDLVNNEGETLIHKPFLIINGLGFGDFRLSDSLRTGAYTLYAYTNYMKNYGDESFFKKEIIISQIIKSEGGEVLLAKAEPSPGEFVYKPAVNLQFMPEGGYLSNNLLNTLGFKLTNRDGKGKNFKGHILDSKGNFIDSLDATHNGMGMAFFRPQRDMKYYAVVNDYPLDTFALPASFDRPQLQYDGITDSLVLFKIRDLAAYSEDKTYYLAIKAKGELSFYLEKKLTAAINSVNIHLRNFRPGLNKAILLDSNFTPLAERLFFIPGAPQLEITLRTNQPDYKTRGKTDISLEIQNEEDKAAGGSFSMAVIHLDQAGISDIPDDNIISYLELSAEIRGNIEDPGYYFSQPYDSVSKNLDLLLLTQGWSKYIWDENYLDSLPEFKYRKEEGLSIHGQAQRLVLNKALEEGNIILFVPSELIIMETNTDSSGMFYFHNLILFDSTKIAVQSKNKKNKPNSRLIDVNYVVTPPPVFPKPEYNLTDSLSLKYYNELAYSRFLNDRYHKFDKDHILLEEVTVVGKKKEEDDGHFRMYSQANNVIDMDEYPNYSYSDLFMFLQGLVPGLYISGDQISIRRAGQSPLILLDGMEIDVISARGIPLNVIDKIEVLKDASNTAVFGMRGGNGVIAIYTRRGENVYYESPSFNLISKSVEGFAQAREFYAPNYENPDSIQKAIDKRATLFWEPNLIPDSTGIAKVTFFNSDDTGRVAVITEGITGSGKPGVASVYYRVKQED